MLRIALVGAGGMARMHADCYAAISNAMLAGVFDIRPDAAESLAARHGARAFSQFDAMLAESKPDIVDVCCPTPWHAEYVCHTARRAKELGIRAVATEKPMARTMDECVKMTAACAAAGLPLFVAHVLRFFPEFALAKREIESGAVGAPAAVRTRRGGAMPRGWNDWFADFDQSGGCVLDLLVHDFDWLRWTFGEVERVYAKSLAAEHLPALDYALVTLRFASGLIGHVEGTWADPGGFKAAMEVAGDKGLLEYNFNQPAGAPFKSALVREQTQRTGAAVPESPLGVSPYQAELQHLVDCVNNHTPFSIAPEDGAAAVRIALAALESIRTGKPITLEKNRSV